MVVYRDGKYAPEMLPRYSFDSTVGVVFYVYLFGKMIIDSVLDDAVLTILMQSYPLPTLSS